MILILLGYNDTQRLPPVDVILDVAQPPTTRSLDFEDMARAAAAPNTAAA